MTAIRVVAISTEIVEAVRKTGKDQQYGFPAYTSASPGGMPCRHCLSYIAAATEHATLFTHDPFAGLEKLPLPGPVYIHAAGCQRYPEHRGIPKQLMASPRTLNAYARGRRLLAQEYVQGTSAEATIARLFARPDVAYVHVHSTTAGCFTFRIERALDSK